MLRIFLFLLIYAAALCGAALTHVWLDARIGFEENRGQARAGILFLVRGVSVSAYVTADSLVGSADQMGLRFIGASPAPVVRPVDLLPGVVNLLTGSDPRNWYTDLPRYARVEVQGVYPGIDLVYHTERSDLTCRIVIQPGASPDRALLEGVGANTLSIGSAGQLYLFTGIEKYSYAIQPAPVAFQVAGDTRVSAAARYQLTGRNTYQIEVASYNPALPLFIELGSGEAVPSQQLADLAVGPSGHLYTAGTRSAVVTERLANPLPGPAEPTAEICGFLIGHARACGDAYVAKFTPSGELVYITYLRGTGPDRGLRIRVDAEENIYVAGDTYSPDFPVTAGAFQRNYAGPKAVFNVSGDWGGGDMFLAKLDSARGLPLYSTFLGGPGVDRSEHLLLDATGQAYVGGSGTPGLPVTSGAHRTTPACEACEGGYVAKLDARGAGLVFATYLEGRAQAMALDALGSVYFAGSAEDGFPVTPGALQATYRGKSDAMVGRLTPDGRALTYATYFGGTGFDYATAIAVDSRGQAWVAGSANSPEVIAGLPPPGSSGSGFLIKLSADGRRLLHASRSIVTKLVPDLSDGVLAYYPYSEVPPGLPTTPDALPVGACVGGYLRRLNADGSVAFATYVPFAVARATQNSAGSFYFFNGWSCVVKFEPAAQPRAFPACVVSAATLVHHDPAAPGQIAPGQIITIFGAGLGPEQGVSFALDAGGRVPKALAGTRVLFNGVPGPVLYAQARQVNAIAPFALAPRSSVAVELEYAGQRDALGLWVTDASFGLFTADGSGSGQAAALNEDGTINSVSNPARLGSVVVLFGTGMGQTYPPSVDGEVAGGTLPKPMAHVGATIPGLLPLQVLYAGAAPGLVAGVTQVNVRLPDTLPTPSRYPLSAMPVSVVVSGRESPGLATVAVR